MPPRKSASAQGNSAPLAPAAPPDASPPPAKFEESLARLEKIVETLESGEMDLDQSLALFEEGRRLSRECLERLQRVEQKVLKAIEQTNGEVKLDNMDPAEEAEGPEAVQ